MLRIWNGRRWAGLFVVAAIAGCGGSDAVPPTTGVVAGTHGGSISPLPDSLGTVEYLMEAEKVAKSTRVKGRGKMRLVAYFANNDGSGGPDPAPSAVTFKDPMGKDHPLAPRPAADDNSKAVRFESEPFESDHDVVGEFKLTLGSNPVTIPVRSR